MHPSLRDTGAHAQFAARTAVKLFAPALIGQEVRSASTLARANQRGVAGVAAGCWVVGGAAAGGAAAGAVAGRARGSQRPFTMRIFRALHLRTAARTLVLDTQMPSTS
jgi:hypothetical protein